MSAIPFGFVGAVGGHMLMGFSLSVISMFGIVALTGVVVNDSLVLIDSANTYRRNGESPLEAVMNGAKRRFRPILLTSLTTFLGLAPMILEKSMQSLIFDSHGDFIGLRCVICHRNHPARCTIFVYDCGRYSGCLWSQ